MFQCVGVGLVGEYELWRWCEGVRGRVLEGDAGVGVVARPAGEGDAGDSGRRNGDERGEPKERGDGLYEVDIDCGYHQHVVQAWECGLRVP